MTKADIVARIAQTTGMTKADTSEVLDALLESISA
ncbi:MAG: DNA-binding protein, partial [Candidatus Latescibacteria bacterium]|nr:DNA-binding protein [Candidatus Latescibacterota bacterium]